MTAAALSTLADEQARLDARPWRPPPATLAEVSALAAHLEAEAQAALWAGAVALFRERSRLARRLYWYKRILWGWRHPGPYLRGHRVAAEATSPTTTPRRGGGVPVYDEAGEPFAPHVVAAAARVGCSPQSLRRHLVAYADGWRMVSRPHPANVGRSGPIVRKRRAA